MPVADWDVADEISSVAPAANGSPDSWDVVSEKPSPAAAAKQVDPWGVVSERPSKAAPKTASDWEVVSERPTSNSAMVPGSEKTGLPRAGMPPTVLMQTPSVASEVGSAAKDAWDVVKETASAPAIPTALNAMVPDKYRQAPTSFAQIYQDNKEAADDLLQRFFGDAYHKGMSDNKSIALLQSLGDSLGKNAAQFLDFLQTPLGALGAATAGSASPPVSGAAKSVFAGSMAPQAIESVRNFAQNPSVETAGPAIVDPLVAASPFSREIGSKLGDIVPRAVNAIDAHNLEAARLLEQERQAGQGIEYGPGEKG